MAGNYTWNNFKDNNGEFTINLLNNNTDNSYNCFKINASNDHSIILSGDNNPGQLKILENPTNGNGSISFKSPDNLTQNVSLTLPETAPDGHFLTSNTNGNLSFQQVPSFILFGFRTNLTNITRQLKTTNGSDNEQGWKLPKKVTATHISMQMIVESYNNSGNIRIQLYKNGNIENNQYIEGDPGSATNNFGLNSTIPSLIYNEGDSIGAKITVPSGITVSNVSVMIRIIGADSICTIS